MNAVPLPPAAVTVYFADHLWRVRSDDGVFLGVFSDRRTAVREATAEVEVHPGWVLVVRATDREAAQPLEA